jgi:hypothetical protein
MYLGEELVCLYGLLDAADMLILVVIEEETSEVFEVWCSPSNGGDAIEGWVASTVTLPPWTFYVGADSAEEILEDFDHW